ncbi:hypothetical protein SAMN05660909_05679 [Chitinophaga terrae (ex Kim and Jung 2007)]|uniref:Uncharacterized protein n=1 Tax=Chitinophaga terrae (ex Kim and Jung 2007) TaxID=408074 RepID=A0A1H4GT93_9BACT|nr:hypothetical protein [Chitinophaga terrae (ex Kim and Jung 2007)]GEP93721.1 hypothetical protein CTE07_53660 [Chitinophaga terrae (ex Kim and Jung 2007)]SEB12551.1 hypothetical protein SAMN05660909_05679 [Chitinophaga terrae (ex Kim and Jung 2007)]
MTQQLFYVPKNIDLDKLIEENPVSHIPGFHRDKLLYILHLLVEIPSNNKDLTNEEGYVPINAEILKQWIGKGYSDYLTYLQDVGIIETDNQFIVGIKSKGYKFCPLYQQPLKSIPITNSTLLRRMTRRQKSTAINNIEQESNENLPVEIDLPAIACKYSPVEKWYETGGLKINDKIAHLYNAEIYLQKQSNRAKWDKNITANGIEWKNPYTQYIGTHLNIEKIKRGLFNAHFDQNVFRYHSALTSCKREIRNAITYEGEELVAIDLSNSQPTLLTLLLNHEFWLNEGEEGKLNSSNIPYLFLNPIFSSKNPFTNFITLVKNAQNNRIKEGDEIWNYYKMVSSGNFYSEFRQLLKNKLDLNYATNEDVKPILFTVLFTDNRFIGQADAAPKRIFRDLFPAIYEITAFIKRHGAENLPILLQRIESFIMYHKVVPRITRERDYLPIFTLHDSIVTLKGNEDYVENVMREEFGKCLGFIPHFKRDYWQESKLKPLGNI